MVTELDLREGGRYSFQDGWDGWISELHPPHHIQFSSSDESFTRFEIRPRDGATHLELIDRLRPDFRCPEDLSDSARGIDELTCRQPGGPGTHWVGVAAGWHGLVDSLESYLAGRPHEGDHRALCRLYDEHLRAEHRRLE